MDTRFIEVRKNIIISRELNNQNSFQANINIDFIPDEMIVKLVRYDTQAAEDEITGIYTDLVSDIITSFSDNSGLNQNITFTLRKPIRGLYNFQFQLPSTDQNTPGELFQRTGDLFIHLEFIKYRTNLPDYKIL